MFQVFVPDVLYVSDVCYKYFYLDVEKVDLNVAYIYMLHSYVCCKCFIWMLHMFAMIFKCFSDVFANVSEACFKCFICLLLYVTIVVSVCFKNKLGVCTWDVHEKRLVAWAHCWGAR
jgi:hypothetical protein